MDKTIISQLRNLGLSEKEASLYLTLLAFGQASVQEIALTANLNRSTAYVLLDSLVGKEFVEQRKKSGVLEYAARMPQELLRKAEEAVVRAEAIHAAIIDASDELDALGPDKKNAPRAIFFEDAEGLKAMRQEVSAASATTDVCGFQHSTTVAELFKRKSGGTRLIVAATTEKKLFPEGLRLIPAEKYPFTSDLYLFENIIVLVSDAEEFAVRIESKEFAELLRETFDLAWEEAGRLDSKIRKGQKTSG